VRPLFTADLAAASAVLSEPPLTHPSHIATRTRVVASSKEAGEEGQHSQSQACRDQPHGVPTASL